MKLTSLATRSQGRESVFLRAYLTDLFYRVVARFQTRGHGALKRIDLLLLSGGGLFCRLLLSLCICLILRTDSVK